MDKSTHYEGGKEYTAQSVTAAEMLEQATLVMDRVTGEVYDPKIKFDELMNSDIVQATLKRLGER